MQFRRPHPWDPGYALPDNVLLEPPLRGAMVHGYRPRRSIDSPVSVPSPWDPGYALPNYIRSEAAGRGVRRTHQLPRGTVGANVPEYLGGLGILSNPLPLAIGVVIGAVAMKILEKRK